MKKIIVLVGFLMPLVLYGQAPEFEWVAGQGGGAVDWGYAIAVDTSGNVYTTGSFRKSVAQPDTADFDPGPGFHGLISNGKADIFVSKLNPEGELIWALSFGNDEDDRGFAISVDASGNVYVTGMFNWNVDFDPGPDVYELSASFSGNSSVFVLKLDTNGSFIWARELGDYSSGGGSGSSWAEAIAVDEEGNVYTTGRARDNSDFDPGPEEYLLTTNTNSSNVFISKLNSNGDFVWAKVIGGEGNEKGNAIAVDDSNDIYITGIFSDIIDFDPGLNEFNISAINGDLFVLKLSSDGNFLWAKNIGGIAGVVDGKSIGIDKNGNVYTTGLFLETVDFDPGTAVYELSASEADVFILKLDINGDFIWVKTIGGNEYSDFGKGIAVDESCNIYVTGVFSDTVDFDPGTGIFSLSATNEDPFILKLDKDGEFIWAGSFAGNEEGSFSAGGEAIVLDRWNNIYTTGIFRDTTDFDPDTSMYNLLTSVSTDIFIHKMRQPCSAEVAISSSAENLRVCSGDSIVLYAAMTIPLEGLFYLWDTGESTDSIIVAPDSNLIISVSANYNSNLNSCSFSDTILLIVPEAIDTTFIELTTCDSTEVGVQSFTYGTENNCDSIVVETSSYLAPPSSPDLSTATIVITIDTPPFTINIPVVPGADSYEWTVPNGVELLTGQGTTSVAVDWGQAASGEICVSALNECGASADTCLQVAVDIKDATTEISNVSYKVFPNPSFGQLNIIFSDHQQYEIRLFNGIGQRVGRYRDVRERASLSVDYLPSGLYWVFISCTSCTAKERVLYKETVEILH